MARERQEKLPPSPIELLITITNDLAMNDINKILKEYDEFNSVVMYANGTVESEIVDLFGFGILERMVTVSIIKAKHSKEIIQRISQDLMFETEEGRGLAFTVPINSIEKEALKLVTSKVGKKNE